MPELSTVDTILDWMHRQAEEKKPIDPAQWMEAALKLNALSSDEADNLIVLEHVVAENRLAFSKSEGTAAKAKICVEALPVYQDLRVQQLKMKRIEEAIRLAKKFAQLKSDEMRNGL